MLVKGGVEILGDAKGMAGEFYFLDSLSVLQKGTKQSVFVFW